jgi:iron-sulfur cluster repair protein YtfE (RIC family)
MAVQMGVRPAAAGAVELLLECHQRIRQFTSLALRLAQAHDLPRAEVAESAAAVRRYFAEALPLHAADEEESMLPRLRGRDPALDGALSVMRREHAGHGMRVEPVVALCAELAASPERHAELAPRLREAADQLERHFAPHLALEEDLLFPALKRALDPASEARMVAEIRARRAGGKGR